MWFFSASLLFGIGQGSLVDGSFLVGAGATGSPWASVVHSIIVQSNASIMVGGSFEAISGNSHSNLARLNSDGSYDASLATGTDGLVYRLLQQPDNKILVAGAFTNLQGVVRKRVGRLLANGEVDSEFDPGSLLEAEPPVLTLAVQPDGKVLVATLAVPQSARLFRLLSNGALDESFVQTNIFMDWQIYTIHVRTNGTILVGGGFSSAGGHGSPALVRLYADGRIDTNFNAQFQNLSSVFTIHEQPNGNLLVGGLFKRLGMTNDVSLARLKANLDWDDSFSADQILSYWGGFPVVRAVVEQPDGKLVVTGDFDAIGGYWRHDIAQLDAQGRVDECFDPGLGLAELHYPAGMTLARHSSDKILVGGYFNSVDGHLICNIARLLPASDCSAIRIHIGETSGGDFYVAGTSPPGGSIAIQSSTNLIHWLDVDLFDWPDYLVPSGSYVIRQFGTPPEPPVFFRVKKSYALPKP